MDTRHYIGKPLYNECTSQMKVNVTSPARSMRDSNMELLIIISMILVIGLHVNYISIGIPSAEDLQASALTTTIRIFLQQLCIVCVNIFVLISGWYGIKPTIKGAFKLLFQVFVIEAFMLGLAKALGATITGESLVKLFVVGSNYWIVPAYLILYFIAPAINAFFEQAPKNKAGSLVLAFFLLQFIYGYLFADLARFGYGYSAISFIGMYSLARFVRKYPARWSQLPIKLDIAVILLMTLIGTVIAVIFVKFEISNIAPQARFNNPLVIITSLYWLLLFSKLSFKSTLINWMAKSSFSIYLTHCQPLVFALLTQYLAECYSKYSPCSYLGIALLFIICICIGSIFIDQIRVFAWNALQKITK